MGGIGPMELMLLLFCFPVYLLPPVASAVFLWLVYKGRFAAKRTCPKCGAEISD
jgi:hypothetical protein